MPPGGVPLDEEEYRRWLESARRTLESARGDLQRGDYNWACFKAHQAAEKALKALLWGTGSPKTGHMLPKLLSAVEEVLGVRAPEEVRDACLRLNKMYIPTRCPGAWTEGIPEEYYGESEAREAIMLAEHIIAWVEEVWRRLSRRGSGR